MVKRIQCKFCQREYSMDRLNSICDGCGAPLLPDSSPEQASLPSVSTESRGDGGTAAAPLRKKRRAWLAVLAGLGLFLFATAFFLLGSQGVGGNVRVTIVEEPVEMEQPESGDHTVPADDDMAFFYDAYSRELNFLVDIITQALDGELDMELEEFYEWLEEEDVILSEYDEILRRLEEAGWDLEWLEELEISGVYGKDKEVEIEEQAR